MESLLEAPSVSASFGGADDVVSENAEVGADVLSLDGLVEPVLAVVFAVGELTALPEPPELLNPAFPQIDAKSLANAAQTIIK